MKSKTKFMSLSLVLATIFTLTSCNGGGSSSSGSRANGGSSRGGGSGNAGFTHSELAYIFVEDLNDDIGVTGYPDLEYVVAKSNTDQYNYMVIYNYYIDEYHAIDISGYDPYGRISAEYYYINLTYPELDLLPLSGGDFLGDSGLIYEKVQATPKDLAKVNALKETILLDMAAKNISAKFGLSMERAKEVGRLQALWGKSSVKAMTDKEVDNFSSELLGFTLTEGIEALTNGSADDLSALVEKAAEKNEITPEHAGKLMTKLFGL